MKSLFDKYVALKGELVNINVFCEDLRVDRDRLQEIVNEYDHCRDTYESNLQRITHLERHLKEAQAHSESMLEHKRVSSYNNTLDLYTELLNVTCDQKSTQPLVTIDLTNTPSSNSCTSQFNSVNKLKKYIKINKFIKKSEKLVRTHTKCLKSINIRRQKLDLLQELQNCKTNLHDKDLEQNKLKSKIQELESLLYNLTNKYECAQHEINNYSKSLDKLIELGNYNMERFTSLTEKCCCETPESPKSCQYSPNGNNNKSITSVLTESITPCSNLLNSNLSLKTDNCNVAPVRRTIIYSDEYGKGLGRSLSESLSQHVINNCLPGASLPNILNKVVNGRYDKLTTLVIALGNCLNVKKSHVIKLVNSLLNIAELGIGKIILCAFPYCHSLTIEQNKFIYYINNLIYNMTCRHNDFLFFDSNKFVTNFCMTGDRFYLPKKQIRNIASLLAYNINDPIISNIMGCTNPISSICTNVNTKHSENIDINIDSSKNPFIYNNLNMTADLNC
ncbi:uncharacterized protein LOC131841979 [Achroia grisella]|uniref:uncharacterized protein LOC131841979 n=1 Tax=Achroia grisella TaxID=688607 RepID=UPI0027D3310A|nr:uncharacterized protein LOC131841979 [Achroia grisella]